MKRLEDELRTALQRKVAPPGFAEHLAGRIRAGTDGKVSRWEKFVFFLRCPKMAWGAGIVVACLIASIGIAQYHNYRKRQAEGAQAKTQLMLALKIAGNKLSLAQRRISEIHNRRVPSEQSGDR